MRRRRRHRRAGRAGIAAVLIALCLWGVVGGAVAVPAAGTASADGEQADRPRDGGVRSDTERVVGATLNVTVAPTTIAAGVGDAVVVSGETATVEDVRLYLVGPRGRFLDADGTAEAMESESVTGGTFSVAYDSFDRRGTYSLLVVSPHADGAFATTETLGRDALPSGMRRQQAIDVVKSAYGRDEVVELTIRGETPSLAVDPFADGTVPREEAVTVSGTSNRGAETSVVVDVLDGERQVATGEVATVNGSTGEWSAELDTSELPPGTYTLFADDGASTASSVLVIVADDAGEGDDGTTPAETPLPGIEGTATAGASDTVDDATGAGLDNATDGGDDTSATAGNATVGSGATTTAATNGTGAQTGGTANATTAGTAESTSEGVPGFGVPVAVVACVVAGLVARRRARD
jgi:PGF-CTERM protein